MHLNACDICKKMIVGDYVTVEYHSREPGSWRRYDICLLCFRKNPLKRCLSIQKSDKATKKNKTAK